VRIPHQKRETPAPITETKLRRRGKEIQGFRTVQEGEEASTSLFPDFKENQHKTESIQGVPKNQIKVPDKAR